MQFAYEAMRSDGTVVADRVEAGDRSAALDDLRDKGLMVMRLDEQKNASAQSDDAHGQKGRRVRGGDLILFTRQMKMLLESGAPLVPALEAAGRQTVKPSMRAMLHRVRERVEEGASLCEALEPERQHFDAVFRSMIAAGEATAALPEVFGRLSDLATRQAQTRKMVIGALLYPAILSLLLVGVMSVLLFFVVPRFRVLFQSLDTALPVTTEMLFNLSVMLRGGWPYLVAGIVLVVGGIVTCLRLPQMRPWLDEMILRLPVVGRIVSRLIFARVLRVWAAMLRCHVPLLDTIQQSREAVSNTAFMRLIDQVEDSVSQGGHVAQAIDEAGLADSVVVSAVRTGEENGRLSEAVDFVSGWMDDENTNLIQQVTRLAEPVILALMGVVVGFVALSLFVPLFDLATAAG